ncbi:MAG TPA: acylase [Gemmatimonadaceae bacterium]|nr:acylase [Gemmatimonadaceae bacterium]
MTRVLRLAPVALLAAVGAIWIAARQVARADGDAVPGGDSVGAPGSDTSAGPAQGQGGDSLAAELLWDRYGVPHIFAPDERTLGRAFGWAQMQAHANLILELYGQARGRAAEYWGAPHEELDTWIRRLGLAANARDWYAAQEAGFRRYLDAFADGMNAWANAHREEIPDSLEVVLPVSAMDVLAHGQRVLITSFVTNPERVQAAARAWAGEANRGDDPGDGGTAAGMVPGSNAWAIAPAKTTSRRAMLLANPHLPWASYFTWFEAQLVAPGMNVYGATLVGMPVIAIGFTDRLGWTHTVNTYDGQDLYELTLEGDGYRWNGAPRAFETRVETLAVKGPNGRLTRRPLTIRSSVHGPVVAEQPGKALALRVAGMDRARAWQQWRDMGRARNLEQFRSALGQMQIPMFTVMYADREGHIMHLFGGLTPVRPSGDWAFWQGIVRGDTSATLWTEYHALGDLPLVIDPRSGWLQNANDPPWTTTFPPVIDPDSFPAYLAPRGMAFRPQRSAELLMMGNDRISFDEVIERKHDTRMVLADRVLDDLLAAVRNRGGVLSRPAAEVLAGWDRRADAESKGAVLFTAWWRALVRASQQSHQSPFATPWDPERPLTSPDALADSNLAIAALEEAATEVLRRHGRLDVAWGEVNRFRRDAVELPANGASGALGVFRVVEFGPEERSPKSVALGGDSFVAIIEFGPRVRALALLGYGNASQPGSPHRVDQLPLLARRELRPVWRERSEIEANLGRAERLPR